MVVTVGTMEAEVGVTLVEAVRLVGAMMEGRGESTVEGINMVETNLKRGGDERPEVTHSYHRGPFWVDVKKQGAVSTWRRFFWGNCFFWSGSSLLCTLCLAVACCHVGGRLLAPSFGSVGGGGEV